MYAAGVVFDCPPAIVLVISDCLQDLLHVEMGMVGQIGGQPCGEHKNMRQMSIQKRTLSFNVNNNFVEG